MVGVLAGGSPLPACVVWVVFGWHVLCGWSLAGMCCVGSLWPACIVWVVFGRHVLCGWSLVCVYDLGSYSRPLVQDEVLVRKDCQWISTWL